MQNSVPYLQLMRLKYIYSEMKDKKKQGYVWFPKKVLDEAHVTSAESTEH